MADQGDDEGLGARLFRFAAISDTHVNPSDDACNSPFPVNARANRRFRHLVADLNHRELDFVLHLGDLVHPVPSSGEGYVQAAEAYRRIVAGLNVPIHVIPGNHDIGDKPGEDAPVPTTSAADIASWQREFGAQYGCFTRSGVRFVLLNAQLINSGLPDEAAQREWAEAIFQTDQRTVLALHHPPFICEPDEPDHYDNLQQPGRDWVLGLAAKPGVELVLAGHAHNFWYDRVGNADYYRLPAISFVRQDYAEMLRAAPGPATEFGRDDAAKLGYMIFDVFKRGCAAQVIRTHGAELLEGGASAPPRLFTPPPSLSQPRLGFDLRQNWAEITEIAPSGALDEFDRKRARNDYPLMGLIEMGVQRIRIPLADLRHPMRRQRLRDLATLGFKPTLFCLGLPNESDRSLFQGLKLESIEVALSKREIEALSNLPSLGVPLFISPIHEHAPTEGGVHKHTIEHGVDVSDPSSAAQLTKFKGLGAAGAVFRTFADAVSASWCAQVQGLAADANLAVSVHLRTGAASPATQVTDASPVMRAIDTLVDALPSDVWIFIDTLITQDRGYFPRPGALCPNCNLTELGAHIASINGQKA